MIAANVIPLGEEISRLPRSLFGRPSTRSYRVAVAEIVRNVKARHRLSNERLAEIVGCDKDTIANAENEATNLNAVTLFSIAYAFGEATIEPVRQLYLCAPPEPSSILTEIDRAGQALNAARKLIEEVQ